MFLKNDSELPLRLAINFSFELRPRCLLLDQARAVTKPALALAPLRCAYAFLALDFAPEFTSLGSSATKLTMDSNGIGRAPDRGGG